MELKNYLKDYTGKLNDHDSYLKMLRQLQSRCTFVEIVLIEGELEDHALIQTFQKDIETVRLVSKWWGTTTTRKNKLVRIRASKELFQYLKRFETFCKYYEADLSDKTSTCYEDRQEITDFGYDDIAFYNEKNEILLCTTTHEGYLFVHRELLNVL